MSSFMEVPSAINRKTKVVVGICTFRRPAMLQRCITSVMQQERPDDWPVEILVVDNDAHSDLGHTLDNVQSQNGCKLHYVIEPNRGIPYARNAVCTYALQQKSDFVLFIDDDEEAAPGWLMAYTRAVSQFDAEAYTGPVRFIFPAGYEDWLANKGFSRTKHGALLQRASTGNVLFRTAILEKYEPPLNFDINMTMTGGSDTDFFMRLVQHGGKIVYVGDAEVSEAVVPVRLTIRWRLRRQYQSSANRVYIESKLFGTKHVMATSLKQVFRHVLEGTLRLVFSPLLLLAGYTMFKRGWYHGLRHYAKAAGTLAGLRGSHVQLYLKTDGH